VSHGTKDGVANFYVTIDAADVHALFDRLSCIREIRAHHGEQSRTTSRTGPLFRGKVNDVVRSQ
jgi:hypothetical protein